MGRDGQGTPTTRAEEIMDENKKKKLEEIGFQVRECCATCKHSSFSRAEQGLSGGFGVCEIQTYDHLKHTDNPRQLSINIAGWCPLFELDPSMPAQLHGFFEFMEKPGKS